MANALQPIKKLKIFVQKILPLVYDNDLSYLETLAKVTDKMNEIVVNYNELITYYNSLDGLLEEIQQRLQELDSEIETFKKQLQEEFAQLKTELENEIEQEVTKINKEFNALKNDLQTQQNDFEQRIQTQINNAISNMQEILNMEIKAIHEEIEANNVELKNYLDSELKKFQEMIPEWQNVVVVSPITGVTEPLQKVLDDMYNLMRVEAITAGEYDEMRYTANQYDKWIVKSIPKGLTAFQYDFYGRRFLYKDKKFYMLHPFYGGKQFYKKIVDFNTQLLRESGSLTANEFDGLMVMAGIYDGKNISANIYDWQSNRNLP